MTGPIAQQPPMCIALVLADAIWHDPMTRKRTILGTFSVIFANSIPAVQSSIAVHCVLTDGYGKTPFTVRLIATQENEDDDELVLLEGKGEIEFIDPRMVAEIDFHFQNVVFPKEGEYRFQLYAANEFLLERRLLVFDPSQKRDES